MIEVIIAIAALALLAGIISFYVGVVSCMYDITKPGETRTLQHPVAGNLLFKVSCTRSENGHSALRIAFIKKNKPA